MKIKKSKIEELIRHLMSTTLDEWKSEDAHPRVVSEPPMDVSKAASQQPMADTQVADTDLPIYDKDWTPGNPKELAMAMKQIGETIPESEVKWFYLRLRKLAGKVEDSQDPLQMRPRLGTLPKNEQ